MKQPRSHLVRELVEIIVLTLLIFFLIRLVVQTYQVDGQSMEPSLNANEYVLINKVAYIFKAPERGDVIVFHYPRDPRVDYIKRIIGLPGDTVRIDSTHVWVNDKLLDEKAYISAPVNPFAKIWKVPPGQYFVLGDNRPVSDDSRYWDYVPKANIIGKAVLVYWPVNKWQFINTHSDTFAGVGNQ